MTVQLPVPTMLRTARLVMRPWDASDAPALLPVLESNVSHLRRWIPAHVATPAPLPELAERLAGFGADFLASRAWRYALFTADATSLLGEADLFPRAAHGRVPFDAADHVELGYWLDASMTGRGLATEATEALLAVAEKLPGMTRAEIRCDPRNEPSAAIPRRLGFVLASTDADTQVWEKPLARA